MMTEMIHGMRTQFDPTYAEKMLELLDEETKKEKETGKEQEPGGAK